MALLLIGFAGLLRTMELLTLQAGQIHFLPAGRGLAVVLPSTKAARARGGVETVLIL